MSPWTSLLLALAVPAVAGAQEERAAPDPHHGRIRVHVRRAGEERGAGGAEVRVFDAFDQRWFPESMPAQSIALALRLLPATTADADGDAWVPEPNGRFRVFASADGWLGMASSTRSPGGVFEVEMVPDPPMRVRVLDADRRAVAEVGVALLGANEREQNMLLELVPTGADGTVALHPGRWRGNERVQRLSVAPFHGDPAAQVRAVDLAELPAEPIELVLVPTGVVEVALVDAAGEPVDAGGDARLEVEHREAGSLGDAQRGFCTAPFVEGRARFEHVPVGVGLVVRPGTPGAATEEESRAVRIAEPGQRVELACPVSDTALGVRARLLRPGGAPLAETPVFVRWMDGATVHPGYTDAQGSLTVSARGVTASEGDGSVEITTAVPHLERWLARVPFTLRGPVLHDLGDVALAPAPLLAAGIVVDELGQPFARVQVQAYEPRSGRGKPEARRDLCAVTGVDGRFALHGPAAGGLLLEATHGDAQPGGKTAVEPGSEDVRLALTRTGAIEARVRFDEGAEASVVFQAFGADGRIVLGRNSHERGRYLVEGLPPGVYTLRCRWGEGGGAILAEVADIAVRPGAATLDPRCDPLDLAGRVHVIALELKAASGPAPASLDAIVREHGGEGAFAPESHAVADGRITLRSPWPTVDLELRAPGLRPVQLSNVTAAASATFEPGLPVRLALAPAAVERLGERALDVVLAFEAASYPRPEATARFDRAGRAELRVCDPGRYNVKLVLTEERPGQTPVQRRTGSPQRVDVKEGGDEIVIDLEHEFVRGQLGL